MRLDQWQYNGQLNKEGGKFHEFLHLDKEPKAANDCWKRDNLTLPRMSSLIDCPVQ